MMDRMRINLILNGELNYNNFKTSQIVMKVLLSLAGVALAVHGQDSSQDYGGLFDETGGLESANFQFDNSLESCQSFANIFWTTCGVSEDPPSLADMLYAEMTCTGVGKCGSTSTYDSSTDECTWQRKLCVTCTETRSQVYIRVQTNGMPMHCYVSSRKAPEEIDLDFEVAWQWDAGSEIYEQVNTQSQQNNLLCDEHDEPPADSGYV